MTRTFTGWHMTAILVLFFGTVMAVNFFMAAQARSSFGGIVVENSYIASQNYNDWLEEADAQQALGWTLDTSWRDDGRLEAIAGGPGADATLVATARHTIGRAPNVDLTFERQENGRFVSQQELPEGRWTVRFELASGQDRWRSLVPFE